MTVPFRNTEQLAAVHRTLAPRIVAAELPKDHLGPPLDLFDCGGKQHARRTPGPHREPPLPLLTRYDVHASDGTAEVVDAFFDWYSRFPAEQSPRGADNYKRRGARLIEVIGHGSYLPEPPPDPKPKQTLGNRITNSSAAVPPVNRGLRTTENESPMYFVEDLRCQVSFERLLYGKGRTSRTRKLERLHCTLLKCKEHGCSWEVNVLGQKVAMDNGLRLEEESGDESESESDIADEMKSFREEVHKTQKRLRKLEARIEKSEKGAKDHEARKGTSGQQVEK